MYSKSLILSLFCFKVINSIDVVNSTGCTSSVCVFSNPYLRIGSGSQNSINNWGLFVQPWYYSETANQWYKLTYLGYPLDTAIGTGNGSSHWSGTNIVDLYSLTPSNTFIDYSNYIITFANTTKTVGYGKIVARAGFVINQRNISFENTFSLGQQDKFVKIISRVINVSPSTIQNLMIWTGTRDDYVGTTDVNTKSRGNLDTGSFVEVTFNNQSSRAIMITNTNEGVLFYSETPRVMTSYALCCVFSNAYNTNPLTLAPRTLAPTDGSYAAVLPIGDIQPNSSGSITWYYAAGTVSSLSTVAQSVAIDQVVNNPDSVLLSASGSLSTIITPSYSPFLNQISQTPSPSTTPSFNIRYIILQAPIPNISVTESHITTTINQKETSYEILYIAIFAPLNIILLCVCCGICFIIRKQKRKDDFKANHKKMVNNLFTNIRSFDASHDIEAVSSINEKEDHNRLNLNEPTS